MYSLDINFTKDRPGTNRSKSRPLKTAFAREFVSSIFGLATAHRLW